MHAAIGMRHSLHHGVSDTNMSVYARQGRCSYSIAVIPLLLRQLADGLISSTDNHICDTSLLTAVAHMSAVQVAHPSSLPFTPLLLVSASQPHQYERQAGRASWQQAMRHSSCRASTSSWLLRGAGLLSSTPTPDGCIDCDQADDSAGLLVGDVDNDDDDVDDDEGSPPSAGSISSWAGGFRQHHSPGRASGRSKATVGRSRLGKASAVSSWSYVYVPGAGDDEESWAGGLTPALFWANCGLLLGSGPMGVEGAALQLVQQHRSWPFGTSAASSTNSTLQLMVGEQQQQQYADGQLSVSSSGNVKQFLVGKHHPAPQGCVSDRAVGAGGTRVVRAAPGAFWLGSTGLAIGNLHESTASDVWRAVDAVLCCGTGLAPALLQEYQAMQVAATRPAAMLVAPRSARCDGTAATDNQPELICSRSAPAVAPGLTCGLELAAESGEEGLVACAAASASSSLHASFWCGQLQRKGRINIRGHKLDQSCQLSSRQQLICMWDCCLHLQHPFKAGMLQERWVMVGSSSWQQRDAGQSVLVLH